MHEERWGAGSLLKHKAHTEFNADSSILQIQLSGSKALQTDHIIYRRGSVFSSTGLNMHTHPDH